jgi:phosphoadenosine phosphosulfate reductase
LLSSYTELRSSGIEVDARERLDQISVVFLDTGDLFPETHAYINYLSTTLDLPIERYRHGLTPDEFKQNVTLLRDSGLSEGDAFDELTKVRPIRQIIEDLGVKVWISGIRRDQSLSRREIPFAEVKNGIIKVYPLADVTNQRAAQMLEERSLTRHPLAHLYRSIGNRQDTRPSSEGHEKSGRHHGEKEECGLHLGWIKHGKTLIYRGESLIPATKFPLVQNRIIPGA